MLFSDIWNENAALFRRSMKIHSNPPILYWFYQGVTSTRRARILVTPWFYSTAWKYNIWHVHEEQEDHISFHGHMAFLLSACMPCCAPQRGQFHQKTWRLALSQGQKAVIDRPSSAYTMATSEDQFGSYFSIFSSWLMQFDFERVHWGHDCRVYSIQKNIENKNLKKKRNLGKGVTYHFGSKL